MSVKRIVFILLLLSTTGIAATLNANKPNILLITIDTLRADRLGCYGYSAAATPVIDELARQGTLFTNAVSHVPLTRPSHTSIFTGLYPYQHNIHDNVSAPLNAGIPTLAEILKRNGYTTAAFVAAFVINSQSGLNRGFDIYNDRIDPDKQPTEFALNLEKRGDQILREFTAWRNKNRTAPYFAWVHLYDPHYPYAPPAPFSQRFKDHPYDGEIAYTDSIIARILRQTPPDTLVILTSDHGESLGDHGENAHSFFIYDATLHVPLIVRWTGYLPAGQKLPMQVRLIDLMPTILDLSGVPLRSEVSGISLKPWLLKTTTPPQELSSYAETFTPWLHFGWSRLLGVRANGWKYIDAPKPELYRIQNDPGEMQNVLPINKAQAKEMKDWLARTGAGGETTPQAQPGMDPETLEKLASLGYAGVARPAQPSGPLADPKDKIEDFKTFNKLIRDGIEAFREERYREAAASFQELENRKIPSFEVHYYLGRSLLRLKSYDKARVEIQKAIETLPHFLPAYRDLAETWEGLGKPEEAEKALLAGLAISPNHPTLVQPLAWLYQRQNKSGAAEKILLTELTAHPEDVESRFRLGAIYRDSGRVEEAIEQYRQILKHDQDDPEAHNQLGMIYGGNNRLKEALAEFVAAQKLDPKNQAIRKNIELVEARMQKGAAVSTLAGTNTVRFEIIQTKSLAAAEAIWRKLQSGEKWEDLARSYSVHPSARSGDPVLQASAAEIDSSLAQALRSLKPGQVSKPVSAPGGFFLVRKL